ncbi:MAG: group 1 glycosyl transferase [Parcubacteria group bacterium Gr01-1014_38]|nr:MAG: group 1 glycosyl transferase [Parcubacteria group bacterium Gr01-1014_38]
MKILFLSPSVPSPLHRTRALNLLSALAKKHEVRLVALDPSHDPGRTLGALSHLPVSARIVPHPFSASLRSCLLALARRQPLELAYCASRAMRAAVAEEIARFRPDLLYVKRLRSAQFVPAPVPTPSLLDVTDAMARSYRRAAPYSPKVLRPAFRREAWAYQHAERNAAQRFRHWVVASPSDQEMLRTTLPPDVRCHVIPNVVDTDAFFPRPEREEPSQLLFSGLLDKVPNISAVRFFVRNVLPRIRARIPDVTLIICGLRPTRAVRSLRTEPSVIIKGFVPDLRPEIARSAVVVVPLLAGSGTRNKILQAWAMGKAVVSTPVGAEGLQTQHGENLLLASSPDAFAAAVTLALKDPSLRARLGAAGRETVERHYSLRALDAAFEPLLIRVTHSVGASR